MNTGWAASPTAKSVPAKDASSMLWFVWSLRFVLTAVMTRALRRIVGGHASKFRTMASTEKKKSATTSPSTSSKTERKQLTFEALGRLLVEFMMIIKLEWEKMLTNTPLVIVINCKHWAWVNNPFMFVLWELHSWFHLNYNNAIIKGFSEIHKRNVCDKWLFRSDGLIFTDHSFACIKRIWPFHLAAHCVNYFKSFNGDHQCVWLP